MVFFQLVFFRSNTSSVNQHTTRTPHTKRFTLAVFHFGNLPFCSLELVQQLVTIRLGLRGSCRSAGRGTGAAGAAGATGAAIERGVAAVSRSRSLFVHCIRCRCRACVRIEREGEHGHVERAGMKGHERMRVARVGRMRLVRER
jgi:hypothetical protein